MKSLGIIKGETKMKKYLNVEVEIIVMDQSDICTVSQEEVTTDNLFECPNFFPAN